MVSSLNTVRVGLTDYRRLRYRIAQTAELRTGDLARRPTPSQHSLPISLQLHFVLTRPQEIEAFRTTGNTRRLRLYPSPAFWLQTDRFAVTRMSPLHSRGWDRYRLP
jgi:hypothetical protein